MRDLNIIVKVSLKSKVDVHDLQDALQDIIDSGIESVNPKDDNQEELIDNIINIQVK